MIPESGNMVRAAEFTFNNMIALPNKEIAEKYRLGHLFSDISELINPPK